MSGRGKLEIYFLFSKVLLISCTICHMASDAVLLPHATDTHKDE
jgi:hypothetical protein